MPDRTDLDAVIAAYGSLLVAYSGGVDSALVAVVARRVLGRQRGVAAIGVSPSLPREQLSRARATARDFDFELLETATYELADARYVANAPDRCFFCKHELFGRLAGVARERGLAVLADGTNAEDLRGHRPGYRASRELAVRAPLVEAGYTKDDVRRHARRLGIRAWDAPSAPCLSSRVMYGLSVTPARLEQVERGETALRALGVRGDLRVRHRGGEARIEVASSEVPLIRRHQREVGERLMALGFDRVTLDLAGYRSGSLLAEQSEAAIELIAERE
jgi:uncharacterized protein